MSSVTESKNDKPDCPLPDKASALIRLALDDLAKIEGDPEYRVSMGSWHEVISKNDYTIYALDVEPDDLKPEPGNVCMVCFAGAVMAKTCDVLPSETVFSVNFPEKTRAKFHALDYFRKGSLRYGLSALRNETDELLVLETNPPGVPDFAFVTPYAEDPTQWRIDMENIVTLLEENGL